MKTYPKTKENNANPIYIIPPLAASLIGNEISHANSKIKANVGVMMNTIAPNPTVIQATLSVYSKAPNRTTEPIKRN